MSAQLSDKKPQLYDQSLIAVDLEMSGLDAKRDRILSIGCVPITLEGIPLGLAQHWLLRSGTSVAQSATIHHLRDCDLAASGEDPDELLPALLALWKHQVLVTHGGELDADFLSRAHHYYHGKPWRPRRLDTQYFAHRRLSAEQPATAKVLSLRHCRQQYHLPSWRAHHALSDAIATAELFQAQVQAAFPKQPNPRWHDVQKSFSSVWMRWGFR